MVPAMWQLMVRIMPARMPTSTPPILVLFSLAGLHGIWKQNSKWWHLHSQAHALRSSSALLMYVQ